MFEVKPVWAKPIFCPVACPTCENMKQEIIALRKELAQLKGEAPTPDADSAKGYTEV